MLMSATGRAGGGSGAGGWEPLSRAAVTTPATTTTAAPARAASVRGRRQDGAAGTGPGASSLDPEPPAPTGLRSCRLPGLVSAGAPISASWVGGRPGGTGVSWGPDAYGASPSAVRTASANSPQLAYRPSGALAIPRASTGSSAAGRSGRAAVTAGGGS